ncbi:MAG: DNA polymerase I [Prevotella sp.]|nr:DNA polymerase I [Prevotella sp.]
MEDNRKILILIDAYALIYRSYYALIRTPRINSKGLNTSAVMGFCNTLNEVMTKVQPTIGALPSHLAVAFDHGKTFRHEMFPDYKAQREETPEDIRLSIPIIKNILEAYKIPVLQVDGFEADDVIGTVAGMGEREGMRVYMLTPDKDYAQLVTENIHMYKPRHGGGYDDMGPKEVCEKYGIESTSQVIDLLGLMGDSSDNYAGCPGVGEKTAAKLINEFGSIEGLLSRTAEIKGKMREKVEGAVDDIRLSKQLATIRTDVPMETTLEEMAIQEADKERLTEIFRELEFKTFAQKILGGGGSDTATYSTANEGKKSANGSGRANAKKSGETQKSVNTQLSLFDAEPTEGEGDDFYAQESQVKYDGINIENAETEEDVLKICEQMTQAKKFSFSVKTTSKDFFKAKIEKISFSCQENEVFEIDITKNGEEDAKTLNEVKKVFENAQNTKIVQNAKFAIEILKNHNIDIEFPIWDTMIAHYLINPDLHHNKQYMEQEYHPAHAAVILKEKEHLEKKLKESGMTQLFTEVEMPLVPVLADMEMNGVRLDVKALGEVQRELEGRMLTLEREIYELAGEQFNIASPRQVGDILFGKMQIMDKPKKTKTGQYVTNEEVLNSLRASNPIVGKILDHRGLKKLLGTYVEALPRLINPQTGHIHTTFNQCVTATGRLSSSDPNLQNIPVRTEDGKEIRRCFIADEGEEFFSADYSQVELRIMASMSGDEHMIEAFKSGQDIHAATSAKINHKTIDEVTKDERSKAKSANFGIIYGISAFGLAQGLGIERKEAKALIDGYFESFPKVMDFIERCKETAREKGYAETLFGRRRYLPDINSRNGTVRAFAERNAVNAPIQGTAADIMKIAMVRVWQRLKSEGLKAKLLLQVHDELNFSVCPEERERVERIVMEEMQGAAQLAVPLTADCGWGRNWLEAH